MFTSSSYNVGCSSSVPFGRGIEKKHDVLSHKYVVCTVAEWVEMLRTNDPGFLFSRPCPARVPVFLKQTVLLFQTVI